MTTETCDALMAAMALAAIVLPLGLAWLLLRWTDERPHAPERGGHPR